MLYSPQGKAGAEDAAEAVIDVAGSVKKPVLTSWMGGRDVAAARDRLRSRDVPTVDTPEQGVRAYMALHRYARNLELLYQTPEELPLNGVPPRNHLKVLLRHVAEDGRELLTEVESKKILDVYGVPISQTEIADSADRAATLAEALGFPVVLKVLSPDITHKSDVGGVLLELRSQDAVKEAFETTRKRVDEHASSARFQGVTVQRMVEGSDVELIVGAKRDPVFGSVILFGRGGTGVELYRDTAAGFPPLNQTLARRLMQETLVYKLLKGYRNSSEADLRGLEALLVRFSQLVIDPARNVGEYAVVIGDPWQGQGLGEKLTDMTIGIAGDKDVDHIEATVLKDNQRMLDLCKKMGFREAARDEDTVAFTLQV